MLDSSSLVNHEKAASDESLVLPRLLLGKTWRNS
jgi:hypothetical protein